MAAYAKSESEKWEKGQASIHKRWRDHHWMIQRSGRKSESPQVPWRIFKSTGYN